MATYAGWYLVPLEALWAFVGIDAGRQQAAAQARRDDDSTAQSPFRGRGVDQASIHGSHRTTWRRSRRWPDRVRRHSLRPRRRPLDPHRRTPRGVRRQVTGALAVDAVTGELAAAATVQLLDKTCAPRSGRSIQSVAIQRCPQLAEHLYAHSAPVRESVVSIPAPRCDHREYQDPALA
jgi:hypothetical protein